MESELNNRLNTSTFGDTDITKGENVDKSLGHKMYQKRCSKIEITAKLPEWEILFYTLYIIACFATSAYSLYRFSKKIEKISEYFDTVDTGWFLGRLKDYADSQWWLMYRGFSSFISLAVIHAVSSFLAHQYSYEYRRYVWVIVGNGAIFWIVGWKYLLFVWTMTTAFYMVTWPSSIRLCWALGLGSLGAMYLSSNQVLAILYDGEDWESIYIMVIATAYIVLKQLSFSLESIKRQNGSSDMDDSVTFTYFDSVVYAFYYPTFFFGPTFIYKSFQPQIIKARRNWQRDEVMYIVQKFTRSIFWMFFLEILLHHIYTYTCAQDSRILKELPLWSLGGVVLYISAFTQTKYWVSYGLASCFMMLDRIEPPANPRCITRLAYFSDYWRYFDPGQHAFFRNYIYIPMGGSRHGYIRQVLATFTSFCFVALWHGGHYFIIVWTTINFFALLIEIAAKSFVRLPRVKNFEEKYFGEAMTVRIHAVCNVPMFLTSIRGFMIFNMNLPEESILFQRLILDSGFTTWITVCFFLYSLTQFSHEVERWENARSYRKKDE